MRGNPRNADGGGEVVWSIPARAGEPTTGASTLAGTTVYPRACGGTAVSVQSDHTTTGLSPRVRGNRRHRGPRRNLLGSIPARAGEPTSLGVSVSSYTVYPRACGGTSLAAVSRPPGMGLSPRVRGNRPNISKEVEGRGSIPARAGEPVLKAVQHHGRGVYPRACGGTSRRRYRHQIPQGLSPRVRGNHFWRPGSDALNGSIPARAGEPFGSRGKVTHVRVYPRACGGTALSVSALSVSAGLSPRVRGNLLVSAIGDDLTGSIPARAGEPQSLG